MHHLDARPRTELGKKAKSLRNQGFFPAVLYGRGVEGARPITLSALDFEKAWREGGESSLLLLTVEGKPYNVLIHEVARDPLMDKPVHADFYAVAMDKKIRTRVPLNFIGNAPAVKDLGGILIKVMHDLEVEALPQDLPHELMVDLTPLEALDTRITAKDIAIPSGVSLLANGDDVIVIVEPPRSEEELVAAPEAAAEEKVAEVKTEQEIKREAKARQASDESPG